MKNTTDQDFIELCQKEFATYNVVYESQNVAIVDGKFRVIFDGISYFRIEDLPSPVSTPVITPSGLEADSRERNSGNVLRFRSSSSAMVH